MPCDQIRTNTIDVPQMNPGLLDKALRALGATSIVVTRLGTSATIDGVNFRITGGRMIVEAGSEHLADRVKVAYSRQTVFHAAKLQGWQVREVKQNVFQVVK